MQLDGRPDGLKYGPGKHRQAKIDCGGIEGLDSL